MRADQSAGSLLFAVFVGPEALAAGLGLFGASVSNAALVHDISSQGAILLLLGSWVIGHLLGYIIMGIALIRSRAILCGPPSSSLWVFLSRRRAMART
jgi:hypothetical protein